MRHKNQVVRNIIIIGLVFILYFTGSGLDVWGHSSKAQQTHAQPKIVIPEPVYDFGLATEGQEVKHDYIVRNEGNADLIIENVSPT